MTTLPNTLFTLGLGKKSNQVVIF